MSSALPDGYTVPVYRSLTQPVLVAGVPKTAAVILGMAAALAVPIVLVRLSLILHIAAFELTLYAVYRFAANRCKTDPHYFTVWRQNRGPRRLVP